MSSAPLVPSTNPRLGSLDGLRGLAALVVLFHHSLLLVPALAQPYFAGYVPSGPWASLALYSPLHLAWAGTESVYLFFVLSGFVLAVSADRLGFDWHAYFPSRLVRLYLPVVGAVLLALLITTVIPRDGSLTGAWINAHTPFYEVPSFLHDITLVTGTSGVVTPLWSLQWEVLFSLLLPLYLLVAGRKLPLLTIAISLVLVYIGIRYHTDFLLYMPMFAIGVALATNWAGIAALGDKISASRFGDLFWAAFVVVSLLFTISYWLVVPYAAHHDAFGMTRPFVVLGVTGIVIAAALWRGLRALLTTTPFAWLGRVSFSLYLVHEPIVVASDYLWHGSLVAIPFAIVVALAVAVGFYFLVERPSHRLSQRIRRTVAARNTQRVGPTVP